jgi:hypothetical protein
MIVEKIIVFAYVIVSYIQPIAVTVTFFPKALVGVTSTLHAPMANATRNFTMSVYALAAPLMTHSNSYSATMCVWSANALTEGRMTFPGLLCHPAQS